MSMFRPGRPRTSHVIRQIPTSFFSTNMNFLFFLLMRNGQLPRFNESLLCLLRRGIPIQVLCHAKLHAPLSQSHKTSRYHIDTRPYHPCRVHVAGQLGIWNNVSKTFDKGLKVSPHQVCKISKQKERTIPKTPRNAHFPFLPLLSSTWPIPLPPASILNPGGITACHWDGMSLRFIQYVNFFCPPALATPS
jgi:hypothetical protein